jgi:hypothetical protein
MHDGAELVRHIEKFGATSLGESFFGVGRVVCIQICEAKLQPRVVSAQWLVIFDCRLSIAPPHNCSMDALGLANAEDDWFAGFEFAAMIHLQPNAVQG